MTRSRRRRRHGRGRRATVAAGLLGAGLLAAGLLAAGLLVQVPPLAANEPASGCTRPLFDARLPNVPGTSVTAVLVDYVPGGRSKRYRHAGRMFAYVLRGAIRSAGSPTGPVRVYRAGEGFFETPGDADPVGENASATEPASLPSGTRMPSR